MKKFLIASILCLISIFTYAEQIDYYVGQPMIDGIDKSILPGEFPYSPRDGGVTMISEVKKTNENEGYFKVYQSRLECTYTYHVKVGDVFYLDNRYTYVFLMMHSPRELYKKWKVVGIEDNKISFEEL